MKPGLTLLITLAMFSVGWGAEPARVLMVTQSQGFVHSSVKRPEGKLSAAEISMTQLGQQSGLFKVTCSQDVAADFTKENLAKYNLVFFYTTGNLPISDEAKDYFFKEWLTTSGHGFVGFHSATDTFKDYKPYWDMVGGSFDGHPWNAGETVTITVHEPNHPAVAGLGGEFQIKDEIYQYKNWQPDKVRVLMSLNMEKCKTKKPYHVPVAWVKEYGQGRVFVTNLGHNEATWANPAFLNHVTGGIKWILHQAEGSATPNPELCAEQKKKAEADTKSAEAAPSK